MTGYSDSVSVVGLLALAGLLGANTLLGPLGLNWFVYPFSETMANQTIGLEAVTLFVVVPWCLVAAWALSRDHHVGPVLVLSPSAYAAYMMVQYVIGPTYLTYRPQILFHLAIFVLSGVIILYFWTQVDDTVLPTLSDRRRRRTVLGLILLAAFVLFRYVALFQGIVTTAELTGEPRLDPSMFWSIVFLDLGLVVPITAGTAIGLYQKVSWAHRALYGIVGWYVLVPISVATMGSVMLLNDDPYAAIETVVVLSTVALLFTAFAVWVYRPLFDRSEHPRTD